MRNVKSIFKNILQIYFKIWFFLFGKRESKKFNDYLSQYKKNYNERTKSENILVDCLYHIELAGLKSDRYLGAMEAVLILNDVLICGNGFNIQKNETYRKYILRLSKEFLSKNGVI
jgi:hypothetical protein